MIGVGRIWGAALANFSVEGVGYNTMSASTSLPRELHPAVELPRLRGGSCGVLNLSIVGRIHHRSGAFGTYGVSEGSNSCRSPRYRWGRDFPKREEL